MDDKIIEFITEIDSTNYSEFSKNATVNSSITLDDEINDYDYSWLNQVEKYLPFINNIINTDYGCGTNKVIKSYENRFIKTLIFRLNDFLLSEQKRFNKVKFNNSSKGMSANLKTITNNEVIDIEIKVKSVQNEDLKKGESYGLSLKERIDRVISITSTLLESDFIKQLEEVSLVHSPISKTILFDEELNYRKALELFNYIDNYNTSKQKINIEEIRKALNEKLLITSFLEYHLLKDCDKVKGEENIYRSFLERLIEKMVLDSTMDEKSFKRMLNKKFEEEYNKKKNREKNIQNIFLKSIDSYNKQVKDALRALKN